MTKQMSDRRPTPTLMMRSLAALALAGVFLGAQGGEVRAQGTGRAWYVAPNGLPTNEGSIDRPLDLAKALSSASPARAGDTIWLRGGTYVGNFTSNLVGSTSAPIVVRGYPGERVTIDGVSPNYSAAALTAAGSDTWFWDFEVTNSHPQRVFSGSMVRGVSITVYGARTKFINLIVHDGGGGYGYWTSAVDAEIYGNVIYNVGGEGSGRGAGHSIYVQNNTGVKRITDTILFNGFSFGIHAYTEGGAINNMRWEGNVAFNHGVLSALSGAKANVLLGGGQVARDAVILDNYLYQTPAAGGRHLDIGYVTACSNPQIQGNYAVNSTPILLNCSNAVMTGNTFYGNVSSAIKTAHPNNLYYGARPTGVHAVVRPNAYERGRGHVIVYNWDRAGQVSVDVSGVGLQAGEAFEVRDGQNYFGAPVLTGVYSGGPVTIPMTSTAVALPVGNAPVVPTHTDREFGVFVVEPESAHEGASTEHPVSRRE